MKVGDLVSLSAAGKKLNMNHDLVIVGGYGMVVKSHPPRHKVVGIRWFKNDGTVLYRGERNVYRWELKKFKKRMNKSEK